LRSGGQLRELEQLDRWLFRILANCYADHFRSHREHAELDEESYIHSQTPEREASRDETIQQVREAIARLPLAQRQVLSLVDLESFSYSEVAEIVDVPVGTVMSRLHRARRSLKGMFEETMPTRTTATGHRIRRIK